MRHIKYVFTKKEVIDLVLKRKEIVAASLVLLIGIAGYLNWSYQDSIQVSDGESYIETGKKLGEAQYVSSVEENVEENTEESVAENTEDGAEDTEESKEASTVESVEDTSGNYFERSRMERESARSKSMEILNATAANTSFDEEIRKKAGEKIINITSEIEAENQIESIAQSKGYSEICVYASDNSVRITVRKDGFCEDDVIKLTEIATDVLNLSANCVKIVEVK